MMLLFFLLHSGKSRNTACKYSVVWNKWSNWAHSILCHSELIIYGMNCGFIKKIKKCCYTTRKIICAVQTVNHFKRALWDIRAGCIIFPISTSEFRLFERRHRLCLNWNVHQSPAGPSTGDVPNNFPSPRRRWPAGAVITRRRGC